MKRRKSSIEPSEPRAVDPLKHPRAFDAENVMSLVEEAFSGLTPEAGRLLIRQNERWMTPEAPRA